MRTIHALKAARTLKAAAILGAAFLFARSLDGCAQSTCKLTSECPSGRCVDGQCVNECAKPIDCPAEKPICKNAICFANEGDGGLPDTPFDAPDESPDTLGDTTPPPDTDGTDTTVVPTDTTPPPDTTGPGTKAYLDSCASDSECASGTCTPVAPRFCTKSCTVHANCADGQICSSGKCRLDDTGKPGCDTTTGAPCLEFCFGSSTAAHCTHTCTSVSECPAGYACSSVGGGKKVCVDTERPCSSASACPSSIGYCGGSGTVGCTAKCDSAADCPLRLVGLPAYTCAIVSGTQVCVPPSDIKGSDPIGTTCSATGTVYCRSGGCDTGSTPPTCNQRCAPRGGCPPGFGCFPDSTGGSVSLICTVAGAGWLGDSCTRARDCLTGLCQAPGYCTRLCNDGLCPTGMSCKASGLTADDGTPISLCSK